MIASARQGELVRRKSVEVSTCSSGSSVQVAGAKFVLENTMAGVFVPHRKSRVTEQSLSTELASSTAFPLEILRHHKTTVAKAQNTHAQKQSTYLFSLKGKGTGAACKLATIDHM